MQPRHISVPHVDWACNVPRLSPDGRNYLSKNTSLVFLHLQNLFLVPLDESPAYCIKDVAKVELSAVDADDVQSPLNFWVQNYGNPVLVGIVVVELRISDHHIPLTKTSHLWIGMTAPKQEKWTYQHWNELDIHCHVGTIGAVFDFYAGTAKRAPKWWQEHSLEWLYRLIKEPKRMWRRYIIGNPLFLWNISKERV